MICATTECSISYSCHQSLDCCHCCCWCTACCSHYWICFFILSHTVGEMLLLLLLLTLTGPTIGSAFARTTFLPRQLRCDLTDLVSTWHFLPLLLLFMIFWNQLMMKGLRSIFKVTFLPPLFQIISSWWGINVFSLGPHHQQFVFAKRADRFSVDNCGQIWPEFPVVSISSILQTSGVLMCLWSPINILKSIYSPFYVYEKI